jgi:Mg/Co/Ni transporter MgtE
VAVFVISRDGEFLGHIPIAAVLRSEGGIKAQELCEPVAAFEHSDDVKDAALDPGIKESVAWYPVFRDHKLIGAVSIWTMLYELQEHSVEATINEAPSGEEDLFTPIGQAVRIRAFWLTINLFTAFLASWVIGWFEVTIQQVVALAILMPVVASMGGIAGSQTLAVALRGLTLNYLTDANLKLVLVKEARIAILNGVMLGTFVAVVVAYWFNSLALGLIILVAITINSLAAASSGTVIPFLLKKMKIDPAVSGAVILTTITDVVGFFVFLSLASLVL